jgi:hypothetical protein
MARKYFKSFQSNIGRLCTSAAGYRNPAAYERRPGHLGFRNLDEATTIRFILTI